MIYKTSSLYIISSFLLFTTACNRDKDIPISKASVEDNITVEKTEFDNYWYAGKAEVSSYDLRQARYGEIREGDAVLVFVTEPFSISKQVKLDRPNETPKDNISVLKLNHIRKFNTGIYDYSMMNSVFTAINASDYPFSLKSTTTSQEWCGHSFTQLNLEGKHYKMRQFSYFESEGDETEKVDVAMLEDGLFNHIRLNNGVLPLEEIDLIPSTFFTRLSHKNIRPAKARISENHSEGRLKYIIEYFHLPRKLTIDVQQEFPHQILAWTEDNGDGLTTSAKLKETLNTAYWSKNSNTNEALRTQLKLKN